MECYIRGILNSKDTAGRLYHMNHYTIGVILHGTREQMARQGFKKVSTTEIMYNYFLIISLLVVSKLQLGDRIV